MTTDREMCRSCFKITVISCFVKMTIKKGDAKNCWSKKKKKTICIVFWNICNDEFSSRCPALLIPNSSKTELILSNTKLITELSEALKVFENCFRKSNWRGLFLRTFLEDYFINLKSWDNVFWKKRFENVYAKSTLS